MTVQYEKLLEKMYSDIRECLESDYGLEPVEGDEELDDELTRQIDEWLDAGNELEDFFDAAGDTLGDMEQYDLSRWTGTADKYPVPAGPIRDALDDGRIEVSDVAHLGEMLEHEPAAYDLSQWQ